MTKKLYSIRLDEKKIIEPLRVIADKENRSVSNIIETVLLEYIKKNKKVCQKED